MTSSNLANNRCLLWLVLCAACGQAAAENWDLRGHLKGNAIQQWFPPGSIFRRQSGASQLDTAGELRLAVAGRSERWSINADYQLNVTRFEVQQAVPGITSSLTPGVLTDERRLFDLATTIHDADDMLVAHRLDRLWIGYTSENSVFRAGRLALSWGNGLFFAPMDIVNPFDPAAVDTEYKPGDDMLYVQRLFSSGNDIEAAWVFRRDPQSGATDPDAATMALRYNAVAGNNEYQLMIADSYDTMLIAAGGSIAIGGTVWRGDLILNDAADWTAQLVANVSYSWQWHGRNVSGALEYYFDGFGLKGDDYTVASVAAAPELAARLARGTSYVTGRHYLAAGATVEITPLWLLTPNVFVKLRDGSALLQLGSRYSLGDNLTLLGALTLPLGSEGTEFRGLRLAPGMPFASRDASLYAQIAWYF